MPDSALRIHSRGTRSVLLVATLSVLTAGCAKPGQSVPDYRNNLNQMTTTDLTIKDHRFNVWLALTDAQRERGLMQVTDKDLADVNGATRGMLFVFANEEYLSFWMYNTITPLDIAFIDTEGRIVKIYTMAPLETRQYPSVEPAQYALEVMAGAFDKLQIKVGDHVEIPDSVLKATQ